MYSANVSRLEFGFDRENQTLVFSGTMSDGSGFRVGFPIAHVAAVFDQEASAMGDPTVIMGDVATIDGFSQRLRHAHRRGYGAAYDRTIRRVGRHAVHYGTNGREFVRNWEQGYYGS